ncbi:unnamed protein product [Acanthoscelides obtectus]|uniref:Transmembrane protein 131 n=1 Tax=Acanthoscelides obtectus TaxID=200917 RepID=A0A9P0KH53_ACAOB|nr:unnamed protein product [Acanthoscelides obtectus]CAK1635756.1 Transmembrane protein 131 [Acanthoscelides obtectus]
MVSYKRCATTKLRQSQTVHSLTTYISGLVNTNMRFFDENLSHIQEEISSIMSDLPLKFQLRFEPPYLDFKQRTLGLPHMEKVILRNMNKNKSIYMTSISGSSVHFHSSFFEDKKISPNGTTSFNVVFLGREEGHVESNLFIHTSEGFLKYNVRGTSTFNHYRIKPLTGIKMKMNTPFSPLIYLHNPFSEPIQIVEIYSSGGGFQLELPSGEQKGPSELWEILPHQTKAVIKVQFQAKLVQNHTGYIRIKLNCPYKTLVVPVEVEVIPDKEVGVFHPQGVLDLGVGGSKDMPREIPLCVQNPHTRHVRIASVEVHPNAGEGRGISVSYKNISLPPRMTNDHDKGVHRNKCVDIATVRVDWRAAYQTKDFSGKIVIKYPSGKNSSEIPYYVSVLKGGLSFNQTTTSYFMNKAIDFSERTFRAKNEYEFPLKITNVVFPPVAHKYFKIDILTPKVLDLGEEADLFRLQLKPTTNLTDIQLHSAITLETDVSDVAVSLLSYNGKVKIHLPFSSKDDVLNVGLLSYNATKEVYFSIFNPNPVPIDLKKIRSATSGASADIYGCGSDDYRLVLFQPSFPNIFKCNNIKPNHYALVKVTLNATNAEGKMWGSIFIETQFELLSIPVIFKVAHGKLDVGPDLIFDQCFPAKICTHPLHVHSTFSESMVIEDILTLPSDKRVTSRHTGHILGKSSKTIGHLFLNPDSDCQPNCYTGLPANMSTQWLKTFSLPRLVAEYDSKLLNLLYTRYSKLTSSGMQKWHNLTLRLDTSEIKGHIFKTRIQMIWPTLFLTQQNKHNRTVSLPLTQLGNSSYQNITLHNPASHSVMIQIVLDRYYPEYEIISKTLPSKLIPFPPEQTSTNFFFHNDTRHIRYYSVFDDLAIKVCPTCIALLLPPGQSQTIQVGFHATDLNIHSALLFLRNNLTILEAIKLTAQSALPSFKFGNRKPGSVQPLSFDMTDKHMKDCEKEKDTSPNLTVKRTFTARNTGELPVYVHSFHINDLECEGYGFRVIECEPFVLPPNGTKKIDIAFTPDLTLTKVFRTLILETSLNIQVNYTLHTTIPLAYLDMCIKAIKGPSWESKLSYIASNIMYFVFILCICLAMIDAKRTKKIAITSFALPNGSTVQSVLDLRLVGQQVREEIQSPKVDRTTNEEKNDLGSESQRTKEDDEIIDKTPCQKQTTLVFATGKTKKKLKKRRNKEHTDEPNEEVTDKTFKTDETTTDTKEERVERAEEEEYSLQRHGEIKKSFTPKRKSARNNVQVYDEEYESGTSDSGSNGEETEKQRKTCSKLRFKSKVEKRETSDDENEDNDRYEVQKHVPSTEITSVRRMKKYPQKQLENVKKDLNFSTNSTSHSQKQAKNVKVKDRCIKERKEKVKFTSKVTEKIKHVEKLKQNDSTAAEKSRSTSNFSLPVWTDGKPKLGYVVGQTEPSKIPSMSSAFGTSKTHNKQKPTVFVEPYKQTFTDLGPIGSRRVDQNRDDNQDFRPVRPTNLETPNEADSFSNMRMVGDLIGQRQLQTNKFRNEGRVVGEAQRREVPKSVDLDELYSWQNLEYGRLLDEVKQERQLKSSGSGDSRWPTENVGQIPAYNNATDVAMPDTNIRANFVGELETTWDHQSYSNTMMEPIESTKSTLEDLWKQNLLDSSSYWANSTHLSNDSPLTPDYSTTNPSSGYLWGSSSVWQPWTPYTTPTRSPPGFDNVQQRGNRDEDKQQQDSINPFDIPNSWTQKQNSPWDYPQEQ